MTTTVQELSVAEELCTELVAAEFGPFFGTPCGILSPLYAALENHTGLLTVTREDNAIAVAAGAAMAGRCPAVLMQNSGLGQSVNAIASLIVPYRIPMLFVISMRGVHPDPTQENAMMGRLTRPLLDGLGVGAVAFEPGVPPSVAVAHVWEIVHRRVRPAALLVSPAAFGWRA